MNSKRISLHLLKIGMIFGITILLAGCSSLFKNLVTKEIVRVPQVVAYLEPYLKENKVFVQGKLVLENSEKADLELDKVILIIEDESKNSITQLELNWQTKPTDNLNLIEAPVELVLGLDVLQKEELTVFVKTAINYKDFNLKIPIASKVAVLKLTALKNSLSGGVEAFITSKIKSDILGNLIVDYSAKILNPFAVDLVLEQGSLNVFVKEDRSLASSYLKSMTLKSKELTTIDGSMKLKDTVGTIIIKEFIKTYSIKTELTGRLKIVDTDVLFPFRIETIQQIDFSMFSDK